MFPVGVQYLCSARTTLCFFPGCLCHPIASFRSRLLLKMHCLALSLGSPAHQIFFVCTESFHAKPHERSRLKKVDPGLPIHSNPAVFPLLRPILGFRHSHFFLARLSHSVILSLGHIPSLNVSPTPVRARAVAGDEIVSVVRIAQTRSKPI